MSNHDAVSHQDANQLSKHASLEFKQACWAFDILAGIYVPFCRCLKPIICLNANNDPQVVEGDTHCGKFLRDLNYGAQSGKFIHPTSHQNITMSW